LKEENLRFLADESCDFLVVRSLRSAGYDVVSVAESFSSASDIEVLNASVKDERILLTEDKDFGEWIFAHREEMTGVLLIRFPGNARSGLGQAVTHLVEKYGRELLTSFSVLEPGRARIRKPT
jgi:predicted nuclease of predicted toxin-antitoxin system